MLFKRLKKFDPTTFITGLALRRLYGRNKKLPRLVRRAILTIPENFGILGHIPGLHKVLPVFDPQKSNFSVIPINKNIQGAEDLALPIEIVDELINRSTVRAVMTKCVCRHNYDCQNYPETHGCLFLGESAKDTPRKWRRMVSKKQAKAHARKGISLGLVPMVGKIRFDSDTLGIRDQGKLMTVCFCCECCCLSRFLAPLPTYLVDQVQHPVEGITIQINDNCVGCGTCVSTCYVSALSIQNGRAVRSDMCRSCGRCAANCPNHAITIRLDNPNVVDDVVNRLLSIVKI